ncbi:MAG: phosphatase PAP2 family protein [Gemmatimonadetes bacterium]|nr:phosphatase PAP2 family protein [Gemmatimonadota bacterium]
MGLAATLGLALQAAHPASACAQVADSTSAERGTPFFTRQDAALAGGFVVGTIVLAQADRRLARTLQDPDLQESDAVRKGAAFFRWMGDPAPQIIGASLYVVGRVARVRPVAALGLHGLEAVVLSSALSGSIKAVAGRSRPYVHADTVPGDFDLMRGLRGHDYTSFPSGHTTSAFAAAAVTTAEIAYWTGAKGWWPGWPYAAGGTLFGGATLVGLSRMYHDRHWASDVVAGAAIGTFSGLKVVKYAYRHPANRLDRWLLPLSVAPAEGGGVAVAWTIPTGAPAAR